MMEQSMMNMKLKMKKSMILGAAIILAICWAGWNEAASDPVSDRMADFQFMHSYAEQTMRGEWQWMLKHADLYAHAADDEELYNQFIAIVDRLAVEPASGSIIADDHFVQLQHAIGEMELTVRLSKISGGRTYLTMMLSGKNDLSFESIRQQLANVNKTVQAIGIKQPDWNITMQGHVHPNLNKEQLLPSFQYYWNSHVSHVYEDNATVSAVINTPRLSRNSNDAGAVNLQAALHRHSETGEIKLTIGSPMIASGL